MFVHTLKLIIKILLSGIICAASGSTITAIVKLIFPDSKLIKMLATQKKTGLPKASSIEWKKVSSTTYTYNNGLSSDLIITNSDTVIYSPGGW